MTWTPLHKKIFLKENPRKGICQKCHKKVGDEYVNCFGEIAIVKETHIHHIGEYEYHDDDPLKDTVELCASCHSKESHRLKIIRIDEKSKSSWFGGSRMTHRSAVRWGLELFSS